MNETDPTTIKSFETMEGKKYRLAWIREFILDVPFKKLVYVDEDNLMKLRSRALRSQQGFATEPKSFIMDDLIEWR